MDREQRQYLFQRMNEISRAHRYDKKPVIKKPAQVKVAEKLIAAWEAGVDKAEEKREARIDAARHKANKAILFDDQKKALAALEAFEKARF